MEQETKIKKERKRASILPGGISMIKNNGSDQILIVLLFQSSSVVLSSFYRHLDYVNPLFLSNLLSLGFCGHTPESVLELGGWYEG